MQTHVPGLIALPPEDARKKPTSGQTGESCMAPPSTKRHGFDIIPGNREVGHPRSRISLIRAIHSARFWPGSTRVLPSRSPGIANVQRISLALHANRLMARRRPDAKEPPSRTNTTQGGPTPKHRIPSQQHTVSKPPGNAVDTAPTREAPRKVPQRPGCKAGRPVAY